MMVLSFALARWLGCSKSRDKEMEKPFDRATNRYPVDDGSLSLVQV